MLGALICLLLFQLLGEVIVRALALPIPGAVLGMLFLFIGLVLRGQAPENLRTTSQTLLQHLMLILVPATTGVMLHFRRLIEEWAAILLAGVGGAAVTMIVTALVLRALVGRERESTG